MKRTDRHRPSAIRPEDYQFVACHYIGCKDLDPGEAIMNAENRRMIWEHFDRTVDSLAEYLDLELKPKSRRRK